MREILTTSLINGAIGSVGATTLIFLYYVLRRYI